MKARVAFSGVMHLYLRDWATDGEMRGRRSREGEELEGGRGAADEAEKERERRCGGGGARSTER